MVQFEGIMPERDQRGKSNRGLCKDSLDSAWPSLYDSDKIMEAAITGATEPVCPRAAGLFSSPQQPLGVRLDRYLCLKTLAVLKIWRRSITGSKSYSEMP